MVFISVLVSTQVFGTTEREKRETAFKKDTQSSYLKYRWAEVAPCSTALRLYEELAGSAKVPDSLRAYAYEASGEFSFAIGEYKKASEQFKSASNLSKSANLRHLWALSLYMSGDSESARSLWHTLSLENKTDYSLVFNFFDGIILLKKGNYAAACSSFTRCGSPDASKPLSLEALSAKYFCSVKLGQTDQSIRYKKELQLLGNSAPQIDWSSEIDNPLKSYALTTLQPTTENTNSQKSTFTVQVGAFGSKENAYGLQKKLSDQFNDVTVATVTLDDKIYYRVRIGTFTTRELAEKFVVDSLQNSGLNAKAIPQ